MNDRVLFSTAPRRDDEVRCGFRERTTNERIFLGDDMRGRTLGADRQRGWGRSAWTGAKRSDSSADARGSTPTGTPQFSDGDRQVTKDLNTQHQAHPVCPLRPPTHRYVTIGGHLGLLDVASHVLRDVIHLHE